MKFYIHISLISASILTIILFVYGSIQNVPQASVASAGDRIIVACQDSEPRSYCYETEVTALLGQYSTEELFSLIRYIRSRDSEYVFCHVLAHEIGEYEVEQDPNAWIDVLANSPVDGICSNGFAHGAIVARFATEYLDEDTLSAALDELAVACESRPGFVPTDLQRAMCYHGLGHVLVHMTEANIPRALAACETIANTDTGPDFRVVCDEGVYMQLFQPLEPEDFALIDKLPKPPTSETIYDWCGDNSANETDFATCWREAWPLNESGFTSGNEITAYCDVLPDSDGREKCYITAFTIVGRHNLERPSDITDICNNVTSDRQGVCFSRTANAYLEEDATMRNESVALCASAVSDSARHQCFTFLAQTARFNFIPGSEPHTQLCATLPESYLDICL